MVLALLLRPFNYEHYLLGQKINLVFGVLLVLVLLALAIEWAIGRWRTRHERGRHAALHRVRARKNHP